MRYKTSELSKILNVSSNTIRRFAEKGYLSPDRDADNQYRNFGDSDVEKITYISKYRKIGLSHDEIAVMFDSDLVENARTYEAKLEGLEKEIARLKSISHMLKDDLKMMKGVELYGDSFVEMDCVSMHYVSYKMDGCIRSGAEYREKIHQFLYEIPENEYIYIIRKEDILARKIRYEEAISIRTKLAEKRGINLDYPVIEHYPKRASIMRIVRFPLDFANEKTISAKEVKRILYDSFFEYMEDKGYVLAGDAIGVKIGFSKENGEEVQYVLFSMPVEPKVD